MAKILNPKNWSLIQLTISLIILMGLVATWFFNYDFPSGKEATLTSFIIIFLRELIILGIFISILIFLLIEKLRAYFKLRKNTNA